MEQTEEYVNGQLKAKYGVSEGGALSPVDFESLINDFVLSYGDALDVGGRLGLFRGRYRPRVPHPGGLGPFG